MHRLIVGVSLLLAVGNVLSKPFDEIMKRSVIQYKNMLECATGHSGWRYEGYGCWCAFNGKGQPVDDADRCCKAHDDCYRKIKDSEICEWPYEYSVYYMQYKNTKNCLECAPASEYKSAKEAQCKVKICECDVTAAKCLKKSTYNKMFAFYDRSKCKKN